MNGNPFRKQAPPPIQTDHPTAAAPDVLPDNHGQQRARGGPRSLPHSHGELAGVTIGIDPAAVTAKRSKTVRISSPPRSPISPPHPSHAAADNVEAAEYGGGYRPARSHHDVPSTPYARTFPRDEEDDGEDDSNNNKEGEDPFGREDSSSGDERSSDTEQMSEPALAKKPAHGAPANPFSRTLATMEEPLRSAMRQNRTTPLVEPAPADKGMPRASMDVDAFKNLLMTGKVTPALPTKSSHQKPQSLTLADNSSSTDTSSISRQSLFEPVQGAPLESPRTSYERSISDQEDDRTDLRSERRKSVKVKPPPPKHRHGKAVAPKGPQVVSFSDFTPSFDGSTTHARPITVSSPPTSPVSMLHRQDSDINKPPPPQPSSRDSASTDKEPTDQKRQSIEASLPDGADQTSLRRKPPAPPVARRSSVLRTNEPAVRTRSNTQNSNLSQTDENSALRSYPESLAESTTSSHKVAPPPPPARRSGAFHLASSSQASSSEEGLTLSRTSSLKLPLPPPSRNRSISALSSPSSAVSGVMSPPPQPPPRRTSSRSSLEGAPHSQTSPAGSRRTSGEHRRSTDVERRAPMASIVREVPITEEVARDNYDLSANKYRQPERDRAEHVATPSAPTQSESDVLAEMEAFQREIDELARQAARVEAAKMNRAA